MEKGDFIHDKECTIKINGLSINGKIFIDNNSVFFLHNDSFVQGNYPIWIKGKNEFEYSWCLYNTHNRLSEWEFEKWLDETESNNTKDTKFEQDDDVKILIDQCGYKKGDIGHIVRVFDNNGGYLVNVYGRISTSSYQPNVFFSGKELELHKKQNTKDIIPEFGNPGSDINNKSNWFNINSEQDKGNLVSETHPEKPKKNDSIGNILITLLFISVFFMITYKIISFIISRINVFVDSIRKKNKIKR